MNKTNLMDTLFDKEIRIIDDNIFWTSDKVKALGLLPYTKEILFTAKEAIEPKSMFSFDVNILVPKNCMQYYFHGKDASHMAVKWVSFCEGESLYFCRSWTGITIFRGLFKEEEDNYRIVKLFINNDPELVDISYFNINRKNKLLLEFLSLMDPGRTVPSIKSLNFPYYIDYISRRYARKTIEDPENHEDAVEDVSDRFLDGFFWFCNQYRDDRGIIKYSTKKINKIISQAASDYSNDMFEDVKQVNSVEWFESFSDVELKDFKNSFLLDFEEGACCAFKEIKFLASTDEESLDDIFGDNFKYIFDNMVEK